MLLWCVVFWQCVNISEEYSVSITAFEVTLMMEAVYSSEKLAHSQNSEECNSPDHRHSHHHENLAPYMLRTNSVIQFCNKLSLPTPNLNTQYGSPFICSSDFRLSVIYWYAGVLLVIPDSMKL